MINSILLLFNNFKENIKTVLTILKEKRKNQRS